MRIADHTGLPIKGIASFSYKGHKIIFDSLNGTDKPAVMVENPEGKTFQISTVENAIKLVDKL